MKFPIKDFFSICDQTRNFLQIWSEILNGKLYFLYVNVTKVVLNVFKVNIKEIKTSSFLVNQESLLFTLNAIHITFKANL